jgi:hypothetical protein
MVVRRIITVRPFSYQTDQKVSIHAFVMVKWNQVEIVKTKEGSDE